MISILFAGDFASRNYGLDFHIESFSDVSEIISSCDYSVVNLETPIASEGVNPIQKQGPSLLSPESMLDGIKALGFKAVTLANNHIYDYGETAFKNTIDLLKRKDIDYVGAGYNQREATLPLIKEIGNKTICFLNCCEQEFSIATEIHAGANHLDTIDLFYQIQEIRNKVDYVILIIHGGIEHFQYPTARMVKTYRFLVDAGVDVIINHHQHCPCGYEVYHCKPIYYGLGNFCFPWSGKHDSIWNQGYMVRMDIDANNISTEIIPYFQCNEDVGVHLMKENDLAVFNKMMAELCNAIQDDEHLKVKLNEYNAGNDYLYRKMLEPYSGKIANGLYRRGLLPTTIKKERILALSDFLICESHYERVKEMIQRLYKQYCNE